MKTIRLFISSPGDVAQEREICRRVIGRLNREFGGRAQLDGYFWEYEPMTITKDYQEQIPPPSSFDIFVCILWSRLGSRLHSKYQLPDGRPCRSGTEFEFVDAVEGRKRNDGSPDILVWVNKTQPLIPLEPEKDYEQRIEQWRSLKAFLDEWTRDSDESVFKGAVNSYRSLEKFEETAEIKLRKLVERRLGQGISSEELPQVQWTGGSPYRGLEAFGKEHADVFFGRTAAIEQVLNAVRRQGEDERGFVLVLGASGSGKSSLVSAGALPLLTTPGVIEGVGLWREAHFRPGLNEDLLVGLAEALMHESGLPELADPEVSDPVASLAERLRALPQAAAESVRLVLNEAARAHQAEQEQVLRDRVRELEKANRPADAEAIAKRLGEGKPPRARLVLVVDQFEELFTGNASKDAQEAFVEILKALAAGGRVVILASLRSDFYHRFQENPELIALTGQHGQVDVLPPQAHEIGQIIREPARLAGLVFEKDAETGATLDEVLRDAAVDQPEALPLLEHALDQLYACQAVRGDRTMRFEDYEAIGQLDGALARHADSVYDSLSETARGAFDKIFRGLVTLGGDEHIPVRRMALREVLATDEASEAFVSAFVDQRLFTTNRNGAGEPTVSVAHEALIRVWDRAKQWIAANEDFLAVRARVANACSQWETSLQDPSFLLQEGRQLAEAEDGLRRHEEAFSSQERAFVRGSRDRLEGVEKRRRRVRQWVMAGMAGLTGLAVVGFVFAQKGRRDALESAAREADAREGAQATSGAAVTFMSNLLGERGWVSRLQERDVNLSTEFFDEATTFMEALADEGQALDLLDAWSRLQTAAIGTSLGKGDVNGAFAAQERAQELHGRLVSALPEDPDVQAKMVRHYDVRGQLYSMIDEHDNALSAYREGESYAEEVMKELDSESLRTVWLVMRQGRVRVSLQSGDREKSISLFGEMMKRQEQWMSDSETGADWQKKVGQQWAERSADLVNVGDFDEAVIALKHGAAAAALMEDEESQLFVELLLQRKWGVLESKRGQHAKAATHFEAWTEGKGELDLKNASSFDLSDHCEVYKQLTEALTMSDQFEKALDSVEICSVLAEQMVKLDSQNLTNQETYELAFVTEGQLYTALGYWDEAAAAYGNASAVAANSFLSSGKGIYAASSVRHVVKQCVYLKENLKLPDEALAAAEEAKGEADALATILEKSREHPQAQEWSQVLAPFYAELGFGHSDGDPQQARAYFEEALKWAQDDELMAPLRDQCQQAIEALSTP